MNRRQAASIALALLLLAGTLGLTPVTAAAGAFTITNPYADVDWDSWGAYKANLHTHSTLSDGELPFNEMVEAHYERGYDVLAMTDHGTVDKSWTQLHKFTVFQFFAQGLKLPAEAPLSQARWQEISAGADRGGRGLLRVPYGIEQNASSLNSAHVNTFFADWGHGMLGGTGDHETPVWGVHRAGGLSLVNHYGEYAKDTDRPRVKAYAGLRSYYVYKLQRLLVKYPSLIGLDINGDMLSNNERVCWDRLLTNLAPTGRNVFGTATSDAHHMGVVGIGWIWAMMPSNTAENFRACLESGAFIAGSYNLKNAEELAVWGETTGRAFGETWTADPDAAEPMITGITAEDGVITIAAEHAGAIHWISDGEVIATGERIALEDCEGLGAYVRAEVWGPGGVLHTQAFLLEYEGSPKGNPVPWYFVDVGGLFGAYRRLIALLVYR